MSVQRSFPLHHSPILSLFSRMPKLIQKPFLLVLACVALVSFRLFSILYSEHYHSDHAIHVLMSYYFRFPEDLYFWGQDRLGSVLPMLTHPITLTGIQPIHATAFMTILVLLAGCYIFTSFLRTFYSKVIFSILWFFPLICFKEILYPAYTDSIQLLIIALIISILININAQQPPKLRYLLYFTIIFNLTGISIWLTETSLILVPLLLLFLVQKFPRDRKLLPYIFVLFGLTAVSWTYFILHAKGLSIPVDNYASLNTPYEAIELLGNIVADYSGILFSHKDSSYSGAAFLGGVLLLTIPFLLYRTEKDFLLTALLLTGLALFFTSVMSHWVYQNGNAAHYFIHSFYLIAAAFLYMLEKSNFKGVTMLRASLIAFTIFAGSTSISDELKGSPHSTLEELEQLKVNGKIAIIGDYWHSYNIAAMDPLHVVATPHDKSHNRSDILKNEVMRSATIYVINDYWMEEFPDTLLQYEHTLIRETSPEKKAGYTIARYRNVGEMKK